ncbi:hypothetical protein [Megasphaera massiliensis]|uniref:hypothetical protein n=2 Tax=Megasphaera TaxID=906 RepID=UPI00399B1180
MSYTISENEMYNITSGLRDAINKLKELKITLSTLDSPELVVEYPDIENADIDELSILDDYCGPKVYEKPLDLQFDPIEAEYLCDDVIYSLERIKRDLDFIDAM